MTAPAPSQNIDTAISADTLRLRALTAMLQKLAAPLLAAVCEVSPTAGQDEATIANASNTIEELADRVAQLSESIAANLGASGQGADDWARWAVTGAASQCVAAHYRASGRPLEMAEADAVVALLLKLEQKLPQLHSADDDVPANSLATFRARMLEALSPVVGAVAQYAFNRQEHALLADIAERLVLATDQLTRALAPAGCSAAEWRTLAYSFLKAAGQLYTESHYAEADRLLYMNPEERAAYFTQHGNVVPMQRVWQLFDQRMAMLATLAAYVDPPATAQLDDTGLS